MLLDLVIPAVEAHLARGFRAVRPRGHLRRRDLGVVRREPRPPRVLRLVRLRPVRALRGRDPAGERRARRHDQPELPQPPRHPLRRVLRAHPRGHARHDAARRRDQPDGHLPGHRAAVDCALHPQRLLAPRGALAGGGAEVPAARRLRFGIPALRHGPHLRGDRAHAAGPDRRRDPEPDNPHRRSPAARGRAAAVRRLRLQGVSGAVPLLDAGRVPGRADVGHDVHERHHQGGRVRRARSGLHVHVRRRRDPLLPALGTGGGAGGDHVDGGRQHRRTDPDERQANARVLGHRAGRVHPHRRRRRAPCCCRRDSRARSGRSACSTTSRHTR